jgi:hypothetical protein
MVRASIANSNVIPGSTYHPATIIDRFPCLTIYMRFGPAIGMHAGYLPGYPASHGCVRMPRDLRGPVFRAGEYSNFGNGERQHAGIDYSPKGYSAFLVISVICAAAKLILIHDAYFFTWAAR